MKLADARRQQMLSVEELAKRAGVAYNTVATIERGGKPRRMDVVRKLSGALDVPAQQIDEFQHLVGNMEGLVAQVAAAQKPLDQAAYEEVNRTGWLSDEDLARMDKAQAAGVPA